MFGKISTAMRLLLFSIISLLTISSFAQNKNPYLIVGTYTSGKSEGIYVYKFNTETGIAEPVSSVKTDNPSYLTISNNGNYVYAVKEHAAKKLNEVSAFSFDKKQGVLQLINTRSIIGSGPCYITVDSKNKWVFTANYKGGSLSGIPINKDGSLDSIQVFNQHIGSSINKKRQQEPHVHCAVFSPDEQYLFTTDLGTDKINRYHFNASSKNNPLSNDADSVLISKAGNGPRHLTFTPNGKYFYVINELSGTIDLFHYKKNQVDFISTISTDSTNNTDKGSADIHVSNDGKFLYATNRGNYNTISTYAINASDGKLTLLNTQPTGGLTPRNFAIDPSDNFLLIGHQRSDNINIFKRNKTTGLLTPTGQTISVGSPVCLKFLK